VIDRYSSPVPSTQKGGVHGLATSSLNPACVASPRNRAGTG
jgi:hypothetical protein